MSLNYKDKRDVNRLSVAANGTSFAQHGGGKKRPRDEDTVRDNDDVSRRSRNSVSGPYGGVSRNNLHDNRRQSNGKGSNSRPSQLVLQTQGGSIARAVFPHAAAPPDPVEYNTPSNSVQASSRRSPSQQPGPSGLSPETDSLMSGSGPQLSLAEVLGEAEVPESPEPIQHEPKMSVSRAPPRSSPSPDPINFFTAIVKPTSTKPANTKPTNAKPTNTNAADPISVEDDSTDDIDDASPPPQKPPSTPKKKTVIQQGLVRKTVEKFDAQSQTQPSIASFLTPTQPSRSGTISRNAARVGPSSKGNPIVPGATRPPSNPQASQQSVKISGRMKPRETAGGLKVSTRGSDNPPTQRPTRTKERELKRQNKELTLKVRDWYCGGGHYEAGQNGRGAYRLVFDGTRISLTQDGIKDAFWLVKTDLESFEVADLNEQASHSELLPTVVLWVKKRTVSNPHWQKFSLKDEDPRVLVNFEPEPDGFTERWQDLVVGLEGCIKKNSVRISNMKSIIQDAANRSSSAKAAKEQAEPGFFVPKVQNDHDPPDREVLPVDSGARASARKPRTRSTVSDSNNSAHDPKPLVIPDPDTVMLVYPPSGTGAVTINRGELARLEPGEFLNDSLIELGLKMWLNDLRERDPTLVDQIHVFSSFFFKKLDGGRGKGCEYDKVKKWTAKFDLFSKKFIIIPINEHLHWYLAIICFPEHTLKAPPPHVSAQPARVTRSSDAAAAAKAAERHMSLESDIPNVDQDSTIDVEAGSPTEPGRMEVDNELADQSQKMAIDSATPPERSSDAMNVDAPPDDHPSEPAILDMTNDDGEAKGASQPIADGKSQKTWILVLDSLGGKHPRTVRLLREYLQSEAQERRKAVVELKDSKTSGGFVEDKHLPAPVQPNWCDCGVYLLHYVEVFHLNPLKILTLPPGAKRKSHPEFQQYEELWQTTQVKQKREAFRDKVHALSSAWLESKRSTSKSDTPAAEPPKPHVTQGPPPLPNLEGDASLQIIEPPVPETIPSTPSSLSSRPPRTGLLPLHPSSEGEVEEEVEILAPEPPASEESNTSKATRRGKKSGTRHGRQGSEVTQGSPDL